MAEIVKEGVCSSLLVYRQQYPKQRLREGLIKMTCYEHPALLLQVSHLMLMFQLRPKDLVTYLAQACSIARLAAGDKCSMLPMCGLGLLLAPSCLE